MQKILNTPYGNSMMLYYSRKLSVYNFTIYESATKKGYCNVWTETDANCGANEICTCLYNYIKEVDARGSVKTLLLYCDSCYGLNKNKLVLSMIRYALSQCKDITTIQINYLIPGHTYMPVDSVHATIETKIRKSVIWAPSQWPTVMEFARQNPEPYKVQVLKGKDFIGFENVVNATFKKSQRIAISKLNIATFKRHEPDVMYIKNSMLPDTEAMLIPLLPLKDIIYLKENLYPTQLGIAVKKYKDLKKLVDNNIIPSRFAQEYTTIKINNKIKDCLADTGEEDETEVKDSVDC
ncbi:unnamed protein product [Diatraea saccharalis]|uniref:DUF7869 domain-containing protein n=1 Tax=Diatraea saccharalis TaxID=40085 RepID=A0A9P0C802_9NEOP|nr:unnamed protein product [Diatraea saccharalis]